MTIEQEITRQLAAGRRIVIVDVDACEPDPVAVDHLALEKLQAARAKETDAARAEALAKMLDGKGDAYNADLQRTRAAGLRQSAAILRSEAVAP
jgi:hypothetical protein